MLYTYHDAYAPRYDAVAEAIRVTAKGCVTDRCQDLIWIQTWELCFRAQTYHTRVPDMVARQLTHIVECDAELANKVAH